MRILTQDGEGTVYIEDKRADGSIVVLICTEAKQGGGRGTDGGPIIDHAPDPGGFPVGYRIESEQPTLTLVTHAMPARRLFFELGPFMSRSLQAFHSGEERIELNPETAPQWGFLPDQRAH
jgi:hypothetical protein